MMLPATSLTNAAAANAMVLQAAKNQLPDKIARDKRVGQQHFIELYEDHATVQPTQESAKNKGVDEFERTLIGTQTERSVRKHTDETEHQQFLFEMEPGSMQMLLEHLEHDTSIPEHIDIDV